MLIYWQIFFSWYWCQASLYTGPLFPLRNRNIHSCWLCSLSSRNFSSTKSTYEPGRMCCLLLNTCCQLDSTWSSSPASSGRPSYHSNCTLAPESNAHGSNCEISLCLLVNYARDPWRSCGTSTWDCSTTWKLSLCPKSQTAAGSKIWWLGILLPQICATHLLYGRKNNSPLSFCFWHVIYLSSPHTQNSLFRHSQNLGWILLSTWLQSIWLHLNFLFNLSS